MDGGSGKRDWRSVSKELLGLERERAIKEHLWWLEVGWVRESIEIPKDYPLAVWARNHSARLAAERAESEGYYRNTKPRPRGRR